MVNNIAEWEVELENDLRRLVINGWEMSKKQHDTPYSYTCDSDIAKPVYDKIRQLLISQKSQLIKKIIDWVKENTKLREVWNEKERDYANDEVVITKDIINFLQK